MNQSKPDSSSSNEKRYVSTAQVALALGVSVTTVKRWVDEDVLPAHRTVGGHRKLLLADVLRLVKAGNLPQANLGLLVGKSGPSSHVDIESLSQQLNKAIETGDAELIRTLIIGAYQAGVPVESLADRAIAPGLAKLGHDWADGRADVMEEHRITQACLAALYELRAMLRTKPMENRPVAVGGAPEHDHYIMPTLLAKLTLLDNDWNAINLGPHTPSSALEASVEALSPQLVWLSATYLPDVETFLRDYRKLHQLCEERKIPIAIGGQALRDDIRSRMQYTTFGDGFTHFAAIARSLHPQSQRPLRGRTTGAKKAKRVVPDETLGEDQASGTT